MTQPYLVSTDDIRKWNKEPRGFPFPAVSPKRRFTGLKKVRDLFVDSSGFGREDEAALTVRAFVHELKAGYAYGITGQGQFQVYVTEYKPTIRRASK